MVICGQFLLKENYLDELQWESPLCPCPYKSPTWSLRTLYFTGIWVIIGMLFVLVSGFTLQGASTGMGVPTTV